MKIKIDIFKTTFHGRRDVIPRFWWSPKTGKSGYSPLCWNEWKKGVCEKPCRSCQNANYVSLSDRLILDHFRGTHILGVYPLLTDGTCWFVAGDFDDHNGDRNPLEDVRAYYEVCQVQEIPCYVLRSKSGNGYHVYIFFDKAVPAWKARIVAFALLQEAGVIGDDAEITSFDRLFPNQDEPTGKGFGNLIALPFQGQAAKAGRHTLLLDPKINFSEPFTDQWGALADIKKVGESILNDLITTWDLKRCRHNPSGAGEPNPEGWLLEAMRGVKEGSRDSTGAKISGYFLNKLPKHDILTLLLAWNTHNEPPLDESAVYKIVESIYAYKKRNADEWEIKLHVAGRKEGREETSDAG